MLLALLQERLGYTFQDPALLDQSLTHKSFANEMAPGQGDYERLEFLGDTVVSLIISTYLYTQQSAASEGLLSAWRARIVSAQGLARLAQQLDLGRFLRLGRGEEHTGGRQKHSLLAAALEALLAAIYLDGGLAAVQDVFLQHFAPVMAQCIVAPRAQDYKGLLQEQALSAFGCLPSYAVVHEEGPAHHKTFHVQLTLHHQYRCVGIGRSKKAAEQHAAKQLLEQLPGSSQRSAIGLLAER
jgi:ribonuclease-3